MLALHPCRSRCDLLSEMLEHGRGEGIRLLEVGEMRRVLEDDQTCAWYPFCEKLAVLERCGGVVPTEM